MGPKSASTPKTNEIAIFGRLLTRKEMSPLLAKYILTLGFSAAEQTHIEHLTERNQRGIASSEERGQLMSYVNAGHLLALLHSKARKVVAKGKLF